VDAVAVCRKRCWKSDWVVDLDIKAFFDSVPHNLMLKAVRHHNEQQWLVLYVERWLKAPMQRPDGTLVPRVKGTPQGSPISPCLANLFLHYALDAWMERTFPTAPFERYADDAVIHCVSERQARLVRDAVARRLVEVGLELNPAKTRIVYCKDSNRRGNYEEISFTFCGYRFRPRQACNTRTGEVFTAFLPALAPEKLTAMSRRVASWRLHRRITHDLNDLARAVNPMLRGWFAYFTAFYPSAVIPLCQRIDRHLMRWARWKYKRLARSARRARAWLRGIQARNPELFAHWRYRNAMS
jgi:group II intron reverse transcriptase/maturase